MTYVGIKEIKKLSEVGKYRPPAPRRNNMTDENVYIGIPAVKCANCGALHEVDSDDYVVVRGNVTIGDNDCHFVGNSGFEKLPFCKSCFVKIVREKCESVAFR